MLDLGLDDFFNLFYIENFQVMFNMNKDDLCEFVF